MRTDCITCSFLPVVGEKERRRRHRQAQEGWPEWNSHLEPNTSTITKKDLYCRDCFWSFVNCCQSQRVVIRELPYPVSSSEQCRWLLNGVGLSVPTDLCTWIDMVPLDLVLQAWWVTHYCNIYKRPFITQHLMNFTLLCSWGNECLSRRGTLSSIYNCTGNGTISHRSINSATLNQESEASVIHWWLSQRVCSQVQGACRLIKLIFPLPFPWIGNKLISYMMSKLSPRKH